MRHRAHRHVEEDRLGSRCPKLYNGPRLRRASAKNGKGLAAEYRGMPPVEFNAVLGAAHFLLVIPPAVSVQPPLPLERAVIEPLHGCRRRDGDLQDA